MIRYEQFFPSVQVEDVHQEEIYQKELSLAREYVTALPALSQVDPCPVSCLQRHEVLFEKWGMRYLLCPKTWSLSLGALPDQQMVANYFYDSDLARYRSTDAYQKTVTGRRTELWSSQIEWIEGRVVRYLGTGKYRTLVWGPRMIGWVDALQKASFVADYIVYEPLPPLEPKGQAEQADLVILSDVIQRCTEPVLLLEKIYNALNPGGLLILTCRSGSGFDILTLAGESESIFPLDHICLPSPGGIDLLLEKAGFSSLELTTPGLLDVKLVQQAGSQIPQHQRFQRYLTTRDQQVQERFQGFLQQNNLSSHLRVVAKKSE